MAAALAMALASLLAEEMSSEPANEAPTETPFKINEPSVKAAFTLPLILPPTELTVLKVPKPKSLV